MIGCEGGRLSLSDFISAGKGAQMKGEVPKGVGGGRGGVGGDLISNCSDRYVPCPSSVASALGKAGKRKKK